MVRSERPRVGIMLVLTFVVSVASHAGAVPCDTITAPPGAIYLYGDDAADSVFFANTFQIDGRDISYTGLPTVPGPLPPVVGFASRTEVNAQEARDSLVAQQLDNVVGAGFEFGPPTIPSVFAVAGPSAAGVDQLIEKLLQLPGVGTVTQTQLNGNAVLGVENIPLITYIDPPGGLFTIEGYGSISGVGILIVDGDFTVHGALDFLGLILVRGSFVVDYDSDTQLSGVVRLYGSMWPTAFEHRAGSLEAYYSSDALALARSAGAGSVCESCENGTLAPGAVCDDGNVCTTGDVCGAGICLGVTRVSCDDGNPCTTDLCHPTDGCRHDPNSLPCDDGDACSTDDTCSAGVCSGTALAGIPAAMCRVQELSAPAACPTQLGRRVEELRSRLATKALALLDHAGSGARPKKRRRLLRKADAKLHKLHRRLVRPKIAASLDDQCRQNLLMLLAEAREQLTTSMGARLTLLRP